MFNDLINAAKSAAQNSHCSATQNKSGAALLSKDGSIFSASTVEGGGSTVFCESVAAALAIADGKNQFLALAVFSQNERQLSLDCLNILSCYNDIWVITCFGDGAPKSTLLSKLAKGN